VVLARTRAHNVQARIFGGRGAGTAHPHAKLPGEDVVCPAAADEQVRAAEAIEHIAAAVTVEHIVAVANAVGRHLRGFPEETAECA
jgi:hypothetical protein